MKRSVNLLIPVFCFVILLQSCHKEGDATLNIHFSSTPAIGMEAVYLDIQTVEISSSRNFTETGWASTQMLNSGVYDLMNYYNGKDTLLSTVNITSSTIRQIKLVLGPDNRVVVNGNDKVISVPESEDSHLSATANLSLDAGKIYEVWIEMDLSQSLVKKTNGQYTLIPRLRTYVKKESGIVDGTVVPVMGYNSIQLMNSKDTLSTMGDSDGLFSFSGISPGTWNLQIIPKYGYTRIEKDSLVIVAGSRLSLGLLKLGEDE